MGYKSYLIFDVFRNVTGLKIANERLNERVLFLLFVSFRTKAVALHASVTDYSFVSPYIFYRQSNTYIFLVYVCQKLTRKEIFTEMGYSPTLTSTIPRLNIVYI